MHRPNLHRHVEKLEDFAETEAPGKEPQKIEVPELAVDFAGEWLGFKATLYQAKLLGDKSKRIVVVFPAKAAKQRRSRSA